MSLTKRSEIGSLEVVPGGHIQVRMDTIIEEDGVELSRSYHRHTCHPDSDMTQEEKQVQDIAVIVHTDEIKAAWEKFKAERDQ